MDRSRVATPVELNISHLHSQPLLPFVASSPPPPSPYNQMRQPHEYINVYPWGWEIVRPLTNGENDGYAVTYVALADPGELLMMACLGSWVDPIYDLMTGADFGDSVTPLVARHWPATFELMCNGIGMERSPGLMKVMTSASQWVIGTFFADESTPEELIFPADPKLQLAEAIRTVVADLTGYPENLPGLLPILAGDDRTSRRLKALASIFGNIGRLGG